MNNENAAAELRMQIPARRERKMTKCFLSLSCLKEYTQSGGPAFTTAPKAGGELRSSDLISEERC